MTTAERITTRAREAGLLVSTCRAQGSTVIVVTGLLPALRDLLNGLPGTIPMPEQFPFEPRSASLRWVL